MKKRLRLFGIRCFLFFLLGEIAIRIFLAVNGQNIHQDTAAYDEELGWQAKAFFQKSFNTNNSAGDSYPVSYATQKYGFRVWDNTTSERKKVFFLGDSFTQAVEVSDTETFYQHIAEKLDIEAFAYGMSGYGTLQELMVLEKYIDSIQPEVLVLQLCTNDFIDNHHKLALDCMYEMPERRPYLQQNGGITYQVPLTAFQRAFQYMKFPEFVYKKSKRIAVNQGWLDVGEKKIAEQGMEYPLFAEAVARTDSLFRRIRSALPDTCQVLAFCADPYEPQKRKLEELAQKSAFHVTNNPLGALQQMESYYHKDQVHWSPLGHKKVAQSLVEPLRLLLRE